MTSPVSSSLPNSEPDRGLPPVTPPSGRFIAQLFVVPGLIVLFVVVLLIGFAYLANSQAGYTTAYFLQRLDSSNPDIRWRAANELAQILNRPEQASLKWKTDPRFALDLAERLESALTELYQKEDELHERTAAQPAADQEAAWQTLRPQRYHVLFLAASLSDFHIPVGAPILCEVSQREHAVDSKGNALRRRQAVWALAKLGDHTRGFAKLPAEEQAAIVSALKQEVGGSSAQRSLWAASALYYLNQPTGTGLKIRHVDDVLAQLADSDDRFLRELVAYAFSFWPGPQAEPTLLRLAHDDGHGTLLEINEAER